MQLQRGKIRKVGDMGQTNHCNVNAARSRCLLQAGRLRILIIQRHPGIGHNPQYWNPCELFQHGKPRLEQRNVAQEFIDNRSGNPFSLILLQQRHRAIELCKYTARVNISHQQHRRIHKLCKAHVYDIISLQVDFRRTASALYHNDVILRCQTVVGGHNIRNQLPLHFEIVSGPVIAPHLTVYNHLTAHIAGGLQQNRVHTHIRCFSRRLGLEHLRTAHFLAVCRYIAVQGHILTFERGHRPAVLPKNPAQCRYQQAFSRPGHGTLDHNTSFHVPVTSLNTASSCRFSASVRMATRYHPGLSP